MKKILFVTETLAWGGAERMLVSLANYLANKNFEITLLTYKPTKETFEVDSKVIRVKKNWQKNLKGIKRLYEIVMLRRYIKEQEFNLVISFLIFPNMISILSTIGLKCKVLISERGDPYTITGFFAKLKNFIYSLADIIIFQTDGAREYYSKCIKRKSKVIPNPIPNSKKFPKWDFEGANIVTVGRLDLHQKRQDVLINAFDKVSKENSKIKLFIYGEGPDKEKIELLIKEKKLEGRIVLAGVTPDILNEMKKYKIFVLTSDYEGIPNTLLEAMAIGMPVISTDCRPGGARMLIEEMKNGSLVRKGDSDELAEKIKFFIENEQVIQKLGSEAKRIITKFSEEKIYEDWIQIINFGIVETKE